jgi:hypothetical protein
MRIYECVAGVRVGALWHDCLFGWTKLGTFFKSA